MALQRNVRDTSLKTGTQIAQHPVTCLYAPGSTGRIRRDISPCSFEVENPRAL